MDALQGGSKREAGPDAAHHLSTGFGRVQSVICSGPSKGSVTPNHVLKFKDIVSITGRS